MSQALTLSGVTSPGTQLDALTALIYLAQTQEIESLGDALQPLLSYRSLALLLADLSQKFDTSNFLRLFLNGLLSHWYARRSCFMSRACQSDDFMVMTMQYHIG
jgi:hypothetical protein